MQNLWLRSCKDGAELAPRSLAGTRAHATKEMRIPDPTPLQQHFHPAMLPGRHCSSARSTTDSILPGRLRLRPELPACTRADRAFKLAAANYRQWGNATVSHRSAESSLAVAGTRGFVRSRR